MRIIGNNPAAENAEITAIASGTLPNGQAVIVNADGTVSVVAGASATQAVGTAVEFENGNSSKYNSATFDSNSNRVVIAYVDVGNSSFGTAIVGAVDSSDNSISFGTAVVFESASTDAHMSAVFDSNSNKIVIAYRDVGNSNFGTAIVGTVDPSDNSISFGTAVVFSSSTVVYVNSTFDSNSNKVVVAYWVAGGNGTAIVGTVSNTSISFGSAAVYNSGGGSYYTGIDFDSTANKVIIAYYDAGNSNFGTAVVGTVSNTSISFGSEVVFEQSASIYYTVTFDSTNNKTVIAYKDANNSNFGTAIVGTVSNTSISFGTPVVFNAGTTDWPTSTFDPVAGNVIIFYNDASNTNKATLSVGTVSGTGISFADEVVVETNNAGRQWTTATFDSNSNKVVLAYDRNDGFSIVFQTAYSSTNLTSENFIGFANGAASDTGTARVQIGSGINGAQSSLTAGQQYFVQTDGTIGLTADDPSVIAGTAVSATDIIVKG